jgi:hypothetical protein
MDLYSPSQLEFATPLHQEARKKSDAKRKAEALAAAKQNIAAQPSIPLTEDAIAYLCEECRSRTPNAEDVATIRELYGQGWSPVAIGYALELYPRVVAANMP